MKLLALVTIAVSIVIVQGDSIWWNRSMNTFIKQTRYLETANQKYSQAYLHDMIRFYISSNPRALAAIRQQRPKRLKAQRYFQ